MSRQAMKNQNNGGEIKMLDKAGYSVNEFVNIVGISHSLGRKLIRENKISVIRLGRRVIIPRSEIERLFEVEPIEN